MGAEHSSCPASLPGEPGTRAGVGLVGLSVCVCVPIQALSPPCVPLQQLESLAWEQSGKSIVSSHSDGGYMVWAVSSTGQRSQQPVMSTIPYGTKWGSGGALGLGDDPSPIPMLQPQCWCLCFRAVPLQSHQQNPLANLRVRVGGWAGHGHRGHLGVQGLMAAPSSHAGTPSSSSVGGCHGPAMVTGTVSACCRARPWPRWTSPPVSLISSLCRVQRCPREVRPARVTPESG